MPLLENICVVLMQTRFPENVGAAARACANMGCHDLRLAMPERWDALKAAPLATRCGMHVLDNIKIYPDLSQALADCNTVWGTSARTGGWRKNVMPPETACAEICALAANGEKTALLFGPEDRGLANSDLALCSGIIHIPVDADCESLNLAQSVLLVLYECVRHAKCKNHIRQTSNKPGRINLSELEILEKEFKQVLELAGSIKEQNSDYFFMQWHDILDRARLRRHEFDALMGFCRNLKNRLP